MSVLACRNHLMVDTTRRTRIIYILLHLNYCATAIGVGLQRQFSFRNRNTYYHFVVGIIKTGEFQLTRYIVTFRWVFQKRHKFIDADNSAWTGERESFNEDMMAAIIFILKLRINIVENKKIYKKQKLNTLTTFCID